MSTKNMARTVIEGGRTRYSKYHRQQTHSIERAIVRETLHRMARDADDGEDMVFEPRPTSSPQFYDKLAPAERWLRAQLGRPWNKVRAELFARFDTRTTAGRHIVFDHLLGWVRTDGIEERWHRYYVCVVGRGGILRPPPKDTRTRRKWTPSDRPAWRDFVAGRRVGARGDVLFWFVPTPAEHFRQATRLSDDESAYWRALPEPFRVNHQMEL